MTTLDCVIIADGSPSPAARRQLVRLLDAHQGAGVRTGLVILRGDRTALGWLDVPDIAARFDDETLVWIDPRTACSAPLTLVLTPMLAFVEPESPLRLQTEQAVIWPIEPCIDLPPEADTDQPSSFAEQAPGIAKKIGSRLNAPAAWAPRTAGERHYLTQNAIGLTLTDGIWWPLLEGDQESRQRAGMERKFVGRHWLGVAPLDPPAFGEFAEAFGDCWPMDLAFHGEPSVLKSLPKPDQSQGMKLLDDDQQPLDAFLGELSLFVAVGDNQSSAPMPLAMFEAMQADVVVIAPPVMSAIIDSPLPKAEPGDLMGLAACLLSDEVAYERARRHQRQLIAERHSAEAHGTRIAPYLAQETSASIARSSALRQPGRVLFVSDDSPYLEHMTRQLAIAQHLPASLKPHFVTTARHARLAERKGYPVDFVLAHNSPPYRHIFDDASSWNFWFERHLAELITFTGARALVFDGVYPFGGVMTNRKRFPNLPFVWIRQPLWRPSAKQDALKHSEEFDLVIEPGDIAACLDHGPLEQRRDQTLQTAPIRLDEPMPGNEARQMLGLQDDRPAFLIEATLPAERLEGETVCMLLDTLEQEGASLWTIDPGKTTFSPPWSRTVKRLDDPDAGRLRSAFDGAISAADYRSVHDNAAAGLPSVLLSGLGSSTDDQTARTAMAEALGWAISLRPGDIYGARAAARQLLEPACRLTMREAFGDKTSDNGAEIAAMAIADLVFSVDIPNLTDDNGALLLAQ